MIKFFSLMFLILLSPYVGFFFVQKKKPEPKLFHFLLGIAAGTFAFLFLFEGAVGLFPWSKDSWLAIIFLVLGFCLNLLLDRVLPNHEHHHHDHCQHPEKLDHLATMVTISLAMHNLIEGTAFGILAATEEKSAFILALMIVLHNIPLNFALWAPEAYIQKTKKHIFKHVFWANFPFLIGAMSFFVITKQPPEQITLGGSFFAFGMIVYLLGQEILPIVWQEKENRKIATLGGVIGLLIVILIELFE